MADVPGLRQRLKDAQNVHIDCVLKKAQGLAFQPENPAHIAIAATQMCSRTEQSLQDASFLVYGTRSSHEFMRVARLTLQEASIGLIVETRAAARRPPPTQPPTQQLRKPPSARGETI